MTDSTQQLTPTQNDTQTQHNPLPTASKDKISLESAFYLDKLDFNDLPTPSRGKEGTHRLLNTSGGTIRLQELWFYEVNASHSCRFSLEL